MERYVFEELASALVYINLYVNLQMLQSQQQVMHKQNFKDVADTVAVIVLSIFDTYDTATELAVALTSFRCSSFVTKELIFISIL